MLEIATISPGGAAEGLGFQPGDIIDTINGEKVHDVIDYRFLVADEQITVSFHSKDGKIRKLVVDKDPDDNLGLEFSAFRILRSAFRELFPRSAYCAPRSEVHSHEPPISASRFCMFAIPFPPFSETAVTVPSLDL